jgi:hypothetical protein
MELSRRWRLLAQEKPKKLHFTKNYDPDDAIHKIEILYCQDRLKAGQFSPTYLQER